MNVYKLTRDYDDPRFSALDFDVSPSLVGLDSLDQDFDGRNPKLLDWEPISLAHFWQPYVALGPVQPYNDYPTISRIPAFSERAVNVLRDFLEPNGELLPVQTNAGTYYAYNILTKSTVPGQHRMPRTRKEGSRDLHGRPRCRATCRSD